MSRLQGCRITLCLALRSVQTGVLIEILLEAIPRCGPEEINYVEARCPHPAPVATFAHLDVTQCWHVNFRVETYLEVHRFLSQPFLRC